MPRPKRRLCVTEKDRLRLLDMIEDLRASRRKSNPYLDALEGEILKARVVDAEHVPEDAVTMNSRVRVRDLDTDETETYRIVYPEDAGSEDDALSVFAPVGTALLGFRVGDTVEWPVPDGVRHIRIEELLYQPEAYARNSGDE